MRLIGYLVALLILNAAPQTVFAQDDDWDVIVAPYIFLASVDGSSTIGRLDPVPLDVSFDDVLGSLEFAGMVHTEAFKGDWGVMSDVFYAKLGENIDTPLGGIVDAEVEEFEFSAVAVRRFRHAGGWFDAYAGLRLWNVDVDVVAAGPLVNTALNRGDNWADPIIGARVIQEFSHDWSFVLRGDIGGFGLSSDITWQAMAGVLYDISETFSISLQYRAMGVDYENSNVGTPDYFAYDTNTHGPQVGFLFKF